MYALLTTKMVSVTPTITAGGYAIGQVMGGVLAFAGSTISVGGSIFTGGFKVDFRSNVSPVLKVPLFSRVPSGTYTDASTFLMNAADRPYHFATLDVLASGYTGIGTPASGNGGSVAFAEFAKNYAVNADTTIGSNLYAVCVLMTSCPALTAASGSPTTDPTFSLITASGV